MSSQFVCMTQSISWKRALNYNSGHCTYRRTLLAAPTTKPLTQCAVVFLEYAQHDGCSNHSSGGDRSCHAAGVRFACLLADAGYGLSAPFRQGLTARKLAWAVGIPRHLKGASRRFDFRLVSGSR
jgi:hypothetical protein